MKKFEKHPMMYSHGFDKENRPIIWIHLGSSKPFLRAVDKNNNNKFNFIVWMIDSVQKKMPIGVSAVIVFDMDGFDLEFPFLMTGIVNKFKCFPDHYPEFLHKAYIINAGSFFNILFGVFDLFLPPSTKAKFQNIQDFKKLKKFIPEKYLLTKYGGKDVFQYSFCKQFEDWKLKQQDQTK